MPFCPCWVRGERVIGSVNANLPGGGGGFDSVGKAHMNMIPGDPNSADATRGVLLRWLDTLAEWQMRHSHSMISRQADKATITSVTQPSSVNERSSTIPCDR
jgi:hypothetical protein